MDGRVSKTLWKWGLAAAFVLGMAGPSLLLFGKAAYSLLTIPGFHPAVVSGALFFRSALIEGAAALLCCIIGVLAALGIWTYAGRLMRQAYMAVLLCALIPPFIHVHSWIKTMDAINSLLESASGLSLNFTGVGATVWSTALSYLPFTTAFCLAGLLSIPCESLDMLKLEIRPRTLFRKCVAPAFLPYVFLGGLFVFLLTMNDYSIPSAFGVNVFALELFSIFGANGDLYAIALSSLPLILLSALLLGASAFVSRRCEMTGDPLWNENPFRTEPFMRKAAGAGVSALVLFAGIPIGSMVVESFFTRDFFTILAESGKEIAYSLLTSLGVAVLAVLPSALLAYLWHREKRRVGLLAALALPFLLPSAILGLSLIVFWNRGVLAEIYQSPFMPMIGLSCRFGILAVLFLILRMGRIERDLTDAARLSCSFFGGFFRVFVPMLWRDLVTCALLVFSLSMGEYGVVLLVTPPGYQMLTIKIYNYLHYGASEVVFALNLVVFLLVAAVWAAVFGLYRPRGNKIPEYYAK